MSDFYRCGKLKSKDACSEKLKDMKFQKWGEIVEP